MLRKDFVDKYNDEMVEAFSELFNTARKKMFHPGDLLLCHQNGTMFGKDTVIGPGEEGLHIRDKIIKKLDVCPKFKEAIKTAYRRQIRNAEAHSQYQIIQGGIWFDNYKKVNVDEVQGIGFEEWEKIYCYSYFIFRGILDHLKNIVQQLYIPYTLLSPSGGIPVLCYHHDGTWRESYLYPDKTGNTWRFVNTMK